MVSDGVWNVINGLNSESQHGDSGHNAPRVATRSGGTGAMHNFFGPRMPPSALGVAVIITATPGKAPWTRKLEHSSARYDTVLVE